jgi:hypothetical protein
MTTLNILRKRMEKRMKALRTLLALVAVVAVLISSGCALVYADEYVNLAYRSTVAANDGKLNAGVLQIENPTATGVQKKGTSYIIGNVKNCYGMKVADSLTSSLVADWVAGALQTELRAAGYSPQLVETLSPGCPRGIKIKIDRVWAEQDMGLWTVGAVADVSFTMQIVKDGQLLKEVDVVGRGQRTRGGMGEAKQKTESLEVALRECMKVAVAEIGKSTI